MTSTFFYIVLPKETNAVILTVPLLSERMAPKKSKRLENQGVYLLLVAEAGTVCQDIDYCGLYKKYSFKLFFLPELTHNSDAFQAVLQAF